jgi:predicted RNA-binding Zn ribbon-like protein
MIFAHDTEVALVATAAMINADLSDVAALDAFLDPWGWTGARAHDDAELAAVQAACVRMREFWNADEDAAVELTNALLREGGALPQLLRHDGWDYHLHATPPDASLDVRMTVETAMAMIDVIRLQQLDRLRICAADDCDAVLVDLSKNRSRRFCEGGCGNRSNVAAYRARRAARQDG